MVGDNCWLEHDPRPVPTRRSSIAPLETDRQRLEEPRENERQWLEPFDRPLQIERCLEPLVGDGRDERPRIFTAGDRLPEASRRSKTRGEIRRRQHGELTERFEPPRAKYRQLG